MSGVLRSSAEVLLESVILFGRDGSLLRLPPAVSHMADTTTGGLVGGLGLDSIGPKAGIYYLLLMFWKFCCIFRLRPLVGLWARSDIL